MVALLFCFFYCYGDHRDLHSFPTRRSSDLTKASAAPRTSEYSCTPVNTMRGRTRLGVATSEPAARRVATGARSEEHTSELQSRLHLVCRLLLEKKKEKAGRERHREGRSARP